MCAKYVAAIASFVVLLGASSAWAGICDYRPSSLVRGLPETAASVAGSGLALKAAGFYTLEHSVTGATMLGSALGGASGAGTVGIMGGSAGAIGSIAGFLMSPVVIGGAVVLVGAEGACYLTDERIAQFEDVYSIVKDIADHSSPEYVQIVNNLEIGPILLVGDGKGHFDGYAVRDLYIVNGELMNSDLLSDTDIGRIAFLAAVRD